jgi:hypothetical protein
MATKKVSKIKKTPVGEFAQWPTSGNATTSRARRQNAVKPKVKQPEESIDDFIKSVVCQAFSSRDFATHMAN